MCYLAWGKAYNRHVVIIVASLPIVYITALCVLQHDCIQSPFGGVGLELGNAFKVDYSYKRMLYRYIVMIAICLYSVEFVLIPFHINERTM